MKLDLSQNSVTVEYDPIDIYDWQHFVNTDLRYRAENSQLTGHRLKLCFDLDGLLALDIDYKDYCHLDRESDLGKEIKEFIRDMLLLQVPNYHPMRPILYAYLVDTDRRFTNSVHLARLRGQR